MATREIQHLAHHLPSSPRERISFFRSLPANKQGFLLLALPGEQQRVLLHKLHKEEIVGFLRYLDPDEMSDLLYHLSPHRRTGVLEKLGTDIREKVEFLLKFDPRSAAGMMSLDYVEVDRNATFGQVSRIIKRHEQRTGKFPTVLVVQDGFLVGELPGHLLLLRNPKELVRNYCRKILQVQYDTHQNEVLHLFTKNPRAKVVVLDDERSILGIIYSDDVLRVLQQQPAQSLSDFAGITDEDILAPFTEKVKRRWWWLVINLGTAFLASWVVGLFQNVIQAFVLLAVYMPIVAGMGGNAATQTLAVMVRGMTLGEVQWKGARRIILHEIIAGVMNGAIIGLIAGGVALLVNQQPVLGLILFLSMMVNLAVAGFFGATIPLLMRALGKDPATSASIFITTATDVCGFFAFLWMASILL